MAYAVQWLRGKDGPQTCADILGYLSLNNRPEREQEYFVEKMRLHPKIQWIPDPNLSEQTWRSGTYMHRPTIPGVKDKKTLLEHLKAKAKKADMSGVSVKDLKDGWPECDAAITELEKEHHLLVVRAKKDGAARTVWLDDPDLFHEVDPDLKNAFTRVELGPPESMVARLLAAQLKPASDDPMVKAAQQASNKPLKKKKAQRRTGKATNVHMQGLLKDYSHTKY
jgi:transcription initiation factor TFIIE subunit beta